MRYQIRQKIFSFGDSFTIKDDLDQDRFLVKGKVFSLGDKLRIEDVFGNELLYIEQQLMRFLPEYYIFSGEQQMARVKKELSFFKSRFVIDSSMGEFEMNGDFFSHDFEILKNGAVVAVVSKKWFSFSDTYGVEISDEENQAFIIALVIVIDQVLHDNKNNR